jgi:hypothetical protein
MNKYLILERYMFEKENLLDQLIPRKDWNKSSVGMSTDQLYNAIKSGEIKPKKAKAKDVETPEIDPSKGSSPNLPAVFKPKFTYSDDSKQWYKTKTAKVIGAAVLSAAIIAIAYKIYKKYSSIRDCSKKIGNDKERCLDHNRKVAIQAQIKTLNSLKHKCNLAKDTTKCLKNVENKIKDLKIKLNNV